MQSVSLPIFLSSVRSEEDIGNRTILDDDFPGSRLTVEVDGIKREYRTFSEGLAETLALFSEV